MEVGFTNPFIPKRSSMKCAERKVSVFFISLYCMFDDYIAIKFVFLDCGVHAEYACSKATEEMCHFL